MSLSFPLLFSLCRWEGLVLVVMYAGYILVMKWAHPLYHLYNIIWKIIYIFRGCTDTNLQNESSICTLGLTRTVLTDICHFIEVLKNIFDLVFQAHAHRQQVQTHCLPLVSILLYRHIFSECQNIHSWYRSWYLLRESVQVPHFILLSCHSYNIYQPNQ